MCGRYARRSDKQKIAELFAIHGPVTPDFARSWNVAPQTFQPVIRLNRDTGEREIVLMGPNSVLGQRGEHRTTHYQCQGGNDHHSASIPRSDQVSPLSRSCRRVL